MDGDAARLYANGVVGSGATQSWFAAHVLASVRFAADCGQCFVACSKVIRARGHSCRRYAVVPVWYRAQWQFRLVLHRRPLLPIARATEEMGRVLRARATPQSTVNLTLYAVGRVLRCAVRRGVGGREGATFGVVRERGRK